MFTYKFRMNFEEQEGFSRDIELRSDQTFLDFQNIIIENLSLDKNLECTFFLCDHFYRKRKRIYQAGNTEVHKVIEEQDQHEKKLFMEKSVLSDYIDDPHQKFIFVYDIDKDWNFYIELLKILPASSSQQYPRIAASVGGTPIEISRKPIVLPGIVEDDEDIDMDEEETDDDDMPEMIMDIGTGEEGEEGHEFEVEDLDAIDDSAFYDDSIEIGEEFDEEK